MDLNIKGIINLKFDQFETADDLMNYVNEHHQELQNIIVDHIDPDTPYLGYMALFNEFSEIWIVNKFLLAKRDRGTNVIDVNPSLSELLSGSTNHQDELERQRIEKIKLEEKNSFIDPENLQESIDNLLDKITHSGIESLSVKERQFLEKNG